MSIVMRRSPSASGRRAAPREGSRSRSVRPSTLLHAQPIHLPQQALQTLPPAAFLAFAVQPRRDDHQVQHVEPGDDRHRSPLVPWFLDAPMETALSVTQFRDGRPCGIVVAGFHDRSGEHVDAFGLGALAHRFVGVGTPAHLDDRSGAAITASADSVELYRIDAMAHYRPTQCSIEDQFRRADAVFLWLRWRTLRRAGP
jgi:hypothetical protein